MSKATVDLTPAEKDALVGGPHGDPFPIPSESDFDEGPAPGRLAADDLEAMARRLIALDRLKVGYLADFTIRVIWMKSGGSSGGKPVFGTVQLASADDKFFAIERAEDMEDDETPFDAKIRLAADNLRAAKATRWNVGYELAGRLCQLGLQVTKKTGAKRLITVAPDASYSFAQMDVFGPQSPEIKRQFFDVKQQQFEWAQTLSEADFATEDDEEAGDYDPSIDLPAGVEAEAGPVEGGAPDAEWADGYERPDLPEFMTDDEDAAVREAGRRIDDHNALVRANFPREFAESDICAACGLFVFDHDPEVCQGGTPETRKRRSRKIAVVNQQIQGEAEGEAVGSSPKYDPAIVLGDSRGFMGSNGNGNHDRDDAAGHLLDPDRVMATLSEKGWKIAFESGNGANGVYRRYVNSETGAPYDTSDVESQYRRGAERQGRGVSEPVRIIAVTSAEVALLLSAIEQAEDAVRDSCARGPGFVQPCPDCQGLIDERREMANRLTLLHAGFGR